MGQERGRAGAEDLELLEMSICSTPWDRRPLPSQEILVTLVLQPPGEWGGR